MNRKERRAAARANSAPGAKPAGIADLMTQARRAYQQQNPAAAEAICKHILAAVPAHAAALNLLGVVYQAASRHRPAVRMLAKAIAADDRDAACHYNIASSYQILGQRDEAALHFTRALLLGLSDKVVEGVLMQNPDLAGCIGRTMQQPALPVRAGVLNAGDIAALANDILLRCAMQTCLLRGVELEFLLTHLRFALLRLAQREDIASTSMSDEIIALFCALAQQCFINEYVYARDANEVDEAGRLRERLSAHVAAGDAAPPLLLAAVAAYVPLAGLREAKALLAAGGPRYVVDLLTQQIGEPLEEAADFGAIPALTGVDDATSREVMAQYGENPYPRWIFDPLSITSVPSKAGTATAAAAPDILIAGCGTGRHAFHVAQQWPQAHILAIDISRPSLAYARRKTREAALQNIEYGQADILNLGAIGRTFDRIEAIGVLHHLADPGAGWRVLLSLLKPSGTLRIGLYSELARQSIVAARHAIAAAGHAATADGIRALRQSIIRDRSEPRWQFLLANAEDFYCTSGCRDLFFNVMEHRFTIPQIQALLAELGLEFLGFELDDAAIEDFQRSYPAPEAHTNLDHWHAFEQARPQTFRHMYVFSVRKYAGTSR
jgi:SAM-dependent methyltransferase